MLLRNIGVQALDLRDLLEQVATPFLRRACGLEVVETVEHVLEPDLVLFELLCHAQQLANAEWGAERRELPVMLARFDALRDLDLALPRKQGHLPHLAQVDPDRIVRGSVEVRGAHPVGLSPGARDAPLGLYLVRPRLDAAVAASGSVGSTRAGVLLRGGRAR